MDELSEKTGVPRSSIGAFEKGTRPLKPEHRIALESVLNAEIVDFSTQNCGVVEEPQVIYSAVQGVFSNVATAQLEALLNQCAQEKDWLAVEKVAAELADRKMKDRLK